MHRDGEKQAVYSEERKWTIGVTARSKAGIVSSKVSTLVERPVWLCPSRSSLGRAHHR